MIWINAVIQEMAEALFNANAILAQEAIDIVGTSFTKVCNHMIYSVNCTCDGLRVCWKCFQVNYFSTRKLVKSKMFNIFKPSYR